MRSHQGLGSRRHAATRDRQRGERPRDDGDDDKDIKWFSRTSVNDPHWGKQEEERRILGE